MNKYKLPSWFVIDTPLSTYNSERAVLRKDKDEEKFFFLVQSKGSTIFGNLRPKETAKVNCGKKQFQAIGSEMIEIKDMAGVEDYALSKENKFYKYE